MLLRLQVNQYLMCWKNRTGAGAWAYNADIEGHAAACRRAQKADPNTVPSVSFKEMNRCRTTHDLEHQRDHRYDQPDLATGKSWSADTIDARVSTEDGKVADALSQLLDHECIRSISEVLTKGGAIDTQAISALAWETSEGQIDIPPHGYWSLHPGMRGRGRPGGLAELPPLPETGHKLPLHALLP